MLPPLESSGFALVVPGYFVCAGVLLFASLTAAVIGVHRGRVPLYLAFAASCFFAAGVCAGMASYYLADSAPQAIEALRWTDCAAILAAASMCALVALDTEAPPDPRAIALVVGATAAFLVASTLLPLGLRFARVDSIFWLSLPWGESLFRVEGPPSGWNLAFRLFMGAVVLWACRRLWSRQREGRRREAAVLAVCVLVIFAASVQGALVDAGLVRGFHAIGFALLGLAFLMGLNLVLRLQEQNVEIRERAYRDPLTGLPNRMAVLDQLAAAARRARPGAWGALLHLNLDHFKVVNDALSHEVGDALLREVASRLRHAVGDEGLLARTGGDDFLVLLHSPHDHEGRTGDLAEGLAREMAAAVAPPIAIGARVLQCSASVGIAVFRFDEAPTAAIARADMALHAAKRGGRDAIRTYRGELLSAAEEKFRLLEGLRHAMQRDELALHFQPQVDDAGNLVGAEALLRWHSAALGDVPPSTFIPVAEETGIIHALGEWSLRQGCAALARWNAAGVPFAGQLSVNVSPWQLARPDFVPMLRALVEGCGIEASRLKLEITESAVLHDVADTVAKLREIEPLGIRIALDDFGTGYSSLALIKDLPLHAVKIDQSFVRQLSEGANRHLVRIVVAVGAELGLEVVAEGVETEADRECLRSLGCRIYQGYLVGKPAPEAAFVAALRDWPAPGAARKPLIELAK